MIDLFNLQKYRENNRIEAKTALNGLPKSIWETYSAFANTSGGIILLGVKENKAGSFETVNIENPEKMIKDFWDIINNPSKTSINILSDRDVFTQNINGDNIIVINVPPIDRAYRPVYINGNPISGTFRRNGEGDYHCSNEEYKAMVRDSSATTSDMHILEGMNVDILNKESIRSYRQRMRLSRPGHVWEELADEDFLLRIGAAAIASDGKKHPTAAGLLMFGNEYDIVREFNNYFLDYQERCDDNPRWTDRIISSSGDWSGNVYDFYFKTYNKLVQDVKIPFKLNGALRVDDTPVHQALREALANCIVNADYYGRQGLVIIKNHDKITFSNPGRFRIEIDAAKVGGVSDPRNSTLLKMFNLIDIGERAGSGIPNIFHVWNEQNCGSPSIKETLEPDRIILTLPITDFTEETLSAIKNGDKCDSDEKSAIKNGDNGDSDAETAIKNGDNSDSVTKTAIKNGDNGDSDTKTAIKNGDKQITKKNKEKIKVLLSNNESASRAEISELLNLKTSRTKKILSELINDGIIIPTGSNRNRRYKLNK